MQKLVRVLAAVGVLGLISSPATAQYPAKPIRLIVPFAAGGATDILARILAPTLTQALGQPVLVENRPGGEGAIGGEFVAKAPPDGYTLFFGGNTSMLGVPILRKNPPYDSVADFTPITSVIRYAFFLVVHPSVPATTLGELVEYGRANPGRLNYGSGNINAQLAAVQMASLGKISLVHVPYKGEAAAMPDLISSRVQLMFATGTVAVSPVKDGKLRALATLLPQRSPLLPDVRTVAEAGMPRLSIVVWTGLFGPARMPKEIVDRLAREFNAVLARPDVREQLQKQSLEPAPSSPGELAAYLKEQLVDWGNVAREAGLNPE